MRVEIPYHWHKVRGGLCDGSAIVAELESEATAPDSHCQGEQGSPSNFALGRTREGSKIKAIAKERCSKDLASPIQDVVESLGASVEIRTVDIIELVGVEPVRGEEHWEKRDNPGVLEKSLDKAQELRAPGWVLHDDDLGAISADDVARVNEEPGKNASQEGEDEKADVGAIADIGVAVCVDVLTKRNL